MQKRHDRASWKRRWMYFQKKGYSKTTFVDIAKRIGLSKGAVYWHFKTKPDLLTELMKYYAEKQCPHMQRRLPESVAELQTMLSDFSKIVETSEEFHKFEYFVEFQIEWSSGLFDEINAKLTEMHDHTMESFQALLEHLKNKGELDESTDPEMLAWQLAAFWKGALHFALRGRISFERMTELLRRNFDVQVGIHNTRRTSDLS